LIGKQLVKIDTIGLVNVIAERKIVPEFIQHQFRKDRMLPEIEKLLFDKNQRAAVINNLKKIKKKLGIPGASTRSAELALATMNSEPKS
jgi:lipid-A-disaccharide synthase